MTDFQTAQLGANDQGWTTRGVPEGRAGGANTYKAPHLRYRDFWADMRVSVACRLEPADAAPTLDALAEALQEPARPLFIGRKPCLPSAALFGGFVEGDSALDALLAAPLADAVTETAAVRLTWPDGEGADGVTPNRTYLLTDQRNWISGLHGGGRSVCEGTVDRQPVSRSPGALGAGQKGRTTMTDSLRTPAAATAATPLQMMRADIDVRAFQRWAGTRRLQDLDYAMHCLLTESFGDLAPKPFRVILPRGAPRGVLYGYGTGDADALREASGICADPLQCRIIPAATLDSKAMPAEWRPGKQLGFETRVRPIVRRTRNADCRPGKEWDAFQLEAIRYPRGEMPRSREKVYADWLSGQFARRGGAQLDVGKTRLVAFQRTRAVRKRRACYSEGPDAVMRGILTITDSGAFAALLAHGIGRHRAYGYGMLLLRPAASAANP